MADPPTADASREALDQIARNFMGQGFSHDESWRRAKMVADAGGVRPDTPPKPIMISARLYEELKDYLAMETDITAGQLLRRLRESNGN